MAQPSLPALYWGRIDRWGDQEIKINQYYKGQTQMLEPACKTWETASKLPSHHLLLDVKLQRQGNTAGLSAPAFSFEMLRHWKE
jgi:hypothetical protein